MPLRVSRTVVAGLATAVVALTLTACDKQHTIKTPLPENQQRIPCEACTPFEGYYQLRDVSTGTLNGTEVWSSVPAAVNKGTVFSGYIMVNAWSGITVYQSGEEFNSQSFTIVPYAFTRFLNYWILTDSTLVVGPEREPGEFFPHLGPAVNRIDTIVWDRRRYVRE